uniref:Ig-like domain-containing protein n=1 Tax=Canis lupus dingo TaxID=286419 RepID=A0A8C0R135_CANLU
MEPPSASPRAGRGPWQELLLSLLTFWNPLTTAQVTVESVPPNAAEGKDVLLRVHNLPGDTASLAWFRGETVAPVHQIVLYVVDTRVITPGPAYSGREIIYPSGSLLFQNITLNDTGSYILQIINRKFETALVPELHKPSITSNNSSPVENADSVVLMCEAQTQSTSCLWSVNSKSLPDSPRLELSLDNRTLTVHGVTRNDTGPYECETRNPVSADHSDPFTLNVLCHGPANSSTSPVIPPSPTVSTRVQAVQGHHPIQQHSMLPAFPRLARTRQSSFWPGVDLLQRQDHTPPCTEYSLLP